MLYIDGPKVERWLGAKNDPGGDVGYSLYFVNWYGRRGLQFHVYTKTDEPDPDTRYNFGRDPRLAEDRRVGRHPQPALVLRLLRGAGSRGRATSTWTTPTSTGTRRPTTASRPSGSIGRDGYRLPALLASDMGRLARFVGIDLLFTPSPLYDPLVTAPRSGRVKVAHVAMLEDEPGSSGAATGSARLRPRASWRRFQPYYRWQVGLRPARPRRRGEARPRHLHRQLRGGAGVLATTSATRSRSSSATSRAELSRSSSPRTGRATTWTSALRLQHHRRQSRGPVRPAGVRGRRLGDGHAVARLHVRQPRIP